MAPDTVSPKAEPTGLGLRWSRKLSLTGRILGVNLFALALLTAGLFFLDSYRARLIAERQNNALNQTMLLRNAIESADAEGRSKLIRQFGAQTKSRVRLYSAEGAKSFDSFANGAPAYVLQDLQSQSWQKIAALQLDRAVDFLVGSAKLSPLISSRSPISASTT